MFGVVPTALSSWESGFPVSFTRAIQRTGCAFRIRRFLDPNEAQTWLLDRSRTRRGTTGQAIDIGAGNNGIEDAFSVDYCTPIYKAFVLWFQKSGYSAAKWLGVARE
jgi:hypothetical protein